jgi:hypothetical protein
VIPILGEILCVLEEIAAAIVGLLVLVINAAIVALGALLSVVLLALPVMPEAPSPPDSGVLQFINFFYPLADAATVVSTLGGLFAGFVVFRIILNWIKAL